MACALSSSAGNSRGGGTVVAFACNIVSCGRNCLSWMRDFAFVGSGSEAITVTATRFGPTRWRIGPPALCGYGRRPRHKHRSKITTFLKEKPRWHPLRKQGHYSKSTLNSMGFWNKLKSRSNLKVKHQK